MENQRSEVKAKERKSQGTVQDDDKHDHHHNNNNDDGGDAEGKEPQTLYGHVARIPGYDTVERRGRNGRPDLCSAQSDMDPKRAMARGV